MVKAQVLWPRAMSSNQYTDVDICRWSVDVVCSSRAFKVPASSSHWQGLKIYDKSDKLTMMMIMNVKMSSIMPSDIDDR